jgi:hypothetical protein
MQEKPKLLFLFIFLFILNSFLNWLAKRGGVGGWDVVVGGGGQWREKSRWS